MSIDSYTVTFLLTQILGTYRIRKFMGLYFDIRGTNTYKEFGTYLIYYILTVVASLYIRIPVVMFLTNIIGISIIVINYKGTIKKKILAVSMMLSLFIAIEMSVGLLMGCLNVSATDVSTHSSEIDLIIIQVLSYILILGLASCRNVKRMEVIPSVYWKTIIIIPIISLLMTILILQTPELKNITIVLSLIGVLLINIFVFRLYNALAHMWENKLEEKLLKQQNNYYEQQFELMKQSIAKTRSLRHDLKNHLCIVNVLSEAKDLTDLVEYLKNMIQECDIETNHANSGNMVVDSIINFKLQDSMEQRIQTNINLHIPKEITITSFDMTVVLGNLLDNAINATKKIKENRKINLDIKYIKGQYIIQISNTYDGQVVKRKERFLTTHKDKENHGIGIKNIKTTIDKYDGIMEIEYTEQEFFVTIIMYG